MSNIMKQPTIKLIPSDPTTSTILIIYCVSSTGASVAYQSTWRKIDQKHNIVQEIKNHSGSSYRCSPLDLDCVIEATVCFQHQNIQITKVIQSNIVKMSRELKEKKTLKTQSFSARVNAQETSLQVKIIVQDGTIKITSDLDSQYLEYVIKITDVSFEVGSNQLLFKIIFNNTNQDYLRQILGHKQKYNNNFIIVNFESDIHRDLVLLAIAEQRKRKSQTGLSQEIISFKQLIGQQRKPTRKVMGQGQGEITQYKNKSLSFFSPPGAYKQKLRKLTSIMPSFDNAIKHNELGGKQLKTATTITSPVAKKQMKVDKSLQNSVQVKQRDYLNVFEEDDLEFLGSPRMNSNGSHSKIEQKPEICNTDYQPSINLRGSFEKLEKSFNSNLNEEAFGRVMKVQQNTQSKALLNQLNALKLQNEKLKKQAQLVNSLISENAKLKKQQSEMKQLISRLEQQRKVVLTEKLRCEVNLHKEMQQKQLIKKELQHLKEKCKEQTPSSFLHPALQKSTKIHPNPNLYQFQRKLIRQQLGHPSSGINRSPNSSFHH